MDRLVILALLYAATLVVAAPAQSATGNEVGVVDVAVQDVYGRDGSKRLSQRDALFFNERITTGADSAVQIDLLDESSLSMGEDSSLVLDSMVYHVNRGVVEGAFTLVSGLIHFESAGVAMDFTVETRYAEIGIRGTEFDVLTDDEETEVSVQEGVVDVTSAAGTQPVFAGQSFTVDSDGNAILSDTPSAKMKAATQQMSVALADADQTDSDDTPAAQNSAVAEAQAAVQQARAAEPELDLSNILALELSGGLVLIEALPDVAPSHVARVFELAQAGVYDNTTFDFVSPGYAAEIGQAPIAETSAAQQPLAQEPSDIPFARGTVGMSRPANDPDGGIGAFFITLGDAPSLDQGYTVWGRVIYGLETLDELSPGRPPASPDAIVKLRSIQEFLKQ